MKTLVIDCRMIAMSGIGRYISELLPFIIAELGKDVVLLGKKDELKQYNNKIIEFDAPIYTIQEQINYRKIIPKSKLFWSPHFNIPLAPIKSEKRITTIHDVYHLAFYKELSIFQKIYAKIVINEALSKSDKIVTVSKFSKNEILAYTNNKYKDKIEVIYNGVSEYQFDKITATPKNDIFEIEQYPYFLFVGNIKPHKNLENALRAYIIFIENLPENIKKPHFKIVGKREGFINGNNMQLGNLINENPIIKNLVDFTGFVSDLKLKELYSQALALVFPSKYEGFGLPLLEAMKYKCPVLASNIPPIKEICVDSALYFDPNSIEDISKKINNIYSSKQLRDNLINKGYSKYKEFSWEESAKKHLNILMKLL